jgi:uncharacterized protein (DUF2267 family)
MDTKKNLTEMTRDQLYKHLLELSPELAKGQSRGKKEELLSRIHSHRMSNDTEYAERMTKLANSVIDEIIDEERIEAHRQSHIAEGIEAPRGIPVAELVETPEEEKSTKPMGVVVLGDSYSRRLPEALAANLHASGVLLLESQTREEMQALLNERGVEMTDDIVATIEALSAAVAQHPDVDSLDDLYARLGDAQGLELKKSSEALKAMFATEEVTYEHSAAPAGPQSTAKSLVHALLRQDPSVLSQMKLPKRLYEILRAAQGVNPRGNRHQRRRLSTLLKTAYSMAAKALASKELTIRVVERQAEPQQAMSA